MTEIIKPEGVSESGAVQLPSSSSLSRRRAIPRIGLGALGIALLPFALADCAPVVISRKDQENYPAYTSSDFFRTIFPEGATSPDFSKFQSGQFIVRGLQVTWEQRTQAFEKFNNLFGANYNYSGAVDKYLMTDPTGVPGEVSAYDFVDASSIAPYVHNEAGNTNLTDEVKRSHTLNVAFQVQQQLTADGVVVDANNKPVLQLVVVGVGE